jgi:hypothetical protein
VRSRAVPQTGTDREERSDEEKRRIAFNHAIRKGSQLGEIDIPPKAVIIEDWFRAGDIGFLFAFQGAGKTWLVLHLCISLATGRPFGPWQVSASWPVLYVDGKMAFHDNKSRILGLHGAIPELLLVLNRFPIRFRSCFQNELSFLVSTPMCRKRETKDNLLVFCSFYAFIRLDFYRTRCVVSN